MSFFEFNGHRVFYREEGHGEPIVFLHNGGNDHRIWDYQVEHFARTHRVIAVDHLGYGNSDKPAIEYTLPLYIDQVRALIDTLRLAPATLVGHCIGAAMSLGYTLLHPSNVRALALFNVATECTLVAGPLKEVYQGFHGNPAARDGFIANVDGKLPREAVLAGLSQQISNPSPEFVEHIVDLWNRPGQMRSLYGCLSNFDTWGAIDTIQKPANMPPVALFWSGANQVLPASAGEEFRRKLNPDTFEIIEGANHMVMREHPDRVNTLIESFLAQHATAAA
jgi:pimeloyl-ACP methyl ester carboxylesterase